MTGGANSDDASFVLDGVYFSQEYDPVAPITGDDAGVTAGLGDAGPHAHILADAGVATESDGGTNAGLHPSF